jgi:hypothetical protein
MAEVEYNTSVTANTFQFALKIRNTVDASDTVNGDLKLQKETTSTIFSRIKHAIFANIYLRGVPLNELIILSYDQTPK